MRKLLCVLIISLYSNFANAEMLATFGLHMGDDVYEGYQVGVVQPLSEFDASAALTDIDNGLFLTLGAQKGFEVFPSVMAYGFFDINRFFWDGSSNGRIKTQLGWGIGTTIATFDPIFVDLKYKKFESYSEPYTYVGLAYMF